jgi:hypothetical protein
VKRRLLGAAAALAAALAVVDYVEHLGTPHGDATTRRYVRA